jgi:hypothetical protein
MSANTQYAFGSDGSEISLDLTRLGQALGGSGSVSIPVTLSVPFKALNNVSSAFTINGPVTFTPDTDNALDGATTYYTLVADGVNTPQFSGFKLSTGTNVYDNRLGIVNVVQFLKLGVNYWYNIFQEVNAQPVDIIPPVLLTARVLTALPNQIQLTFNEPLVQNNAALGNFSAVGGTITTLNVVGAVATLTLNTAATTGTSLSVGYIKPANGLSDTALNQVVNFSSIPVDVFSKSTPLPLASRSATVSNAGTTFSSSVSGWTSCAVDTRPLIDGASISCVMPSGAAEGSMIALDNDTLVTTGTVYTQWSYFVWVSGATYLQGSNGGSVANTGVTVAPNDTVRLRRSGLSIIAEVQRVSTVVWLPVYTFPLAISTTLYGKFSTFGFTYRDPLYTEVF